MNKKVLSVSMTFVMLASELFFNRPIKSKALFVNSPAVVKETTLDRIDLSQYSQKSTVLSYYTTLEAAPYGYVEVNLLVTYFGTAHIGNNDYLFMRYDSLATYHPGITIKDNSNYKQKYYSCTTSQAFYSPNNVSPKTTLLDYWPRNSSAADPVARYYLNDEGNSYQVCNENVWPGLSSIFGDNEYITPDSMLYIIEDGVNSENFYSIQAVNQITDPKTYSVVALNNYSGCNAKFYDFTSDKHAGENGIKTNQIVFTFYYGSLFAIKKENNKFLEEINWYSNFEVGSKNIFNAIYFNTQLEFQIHTTFILE